MYEIRRACCGHWLLMNTLQILNVFLQLKWNQKVKLFVNRCSVTSKKLRHIFYGLLIDCDFFIWICGISGNIYYFFTLQLVTLALLFSLFLPKTLSQRWDSAEIWVLWYYWLIMAFYVIICVGTYSNRNAQIE